MNYKEVCLSICKEEGYDYDLVTTRSRKRELVITRQLCMYFGAMFFRNKITFAALAEPFGRDHATINHAVKTINNLMFSDKLLRARVMQYTIKFEKMKTEATIITVQEEIKRNEVAHELIMRLSEMRIIAEAYCLLSGHKLIPLKNDEN